MTKKMTVILVVLFAVSCSTTSDSYYNGILLEVISSSIVSSDWSDSDFGKSLRDDIDRHYKNYKVGFLENDEWNKDNLKEKIQKLCAKNVLDKTYKGDFYLWRYNLIYGNRKFVCYIGVDDMVYNSNTLKASNISYTYLVIELFDK